MMWNTLTHKMPRNKHCNTPCKRKLHRCKHSVLPAFLILLSPPPIVPTSMDMVIFSHSVSACRCLFTASRRAAYAQSLQAQQQAELQLAAYRSFKNSELIFLQQRRAKLAAALQILRNETQKIRSVTHADLLLSTTVSVTPVTPNCCKPNYNCKTFCSKKRHCKHSSPRRIFSIVISEENNCMNNIILCALALTCSIATYAPAADDEANMSVEHQHGFYYTCSMHPDVKEHEPGKCPICNMNLTKVEIEPDEPAQDHYPTNTTKNFTTPVRCIQMLNRMSPANVPSAT